MEAIVFRNDGSPNALKCEDIEKPVPGDNQILVKVRAASVNPIDGFPLFVGRVTRILAGLRKPKVTQLDNLGRYSIVSKSARYFLINACATIGGLTPCLIG